MVETFNFQVLTLCSNRIHSLKYRRSTPSSYKDIRHFELDRKVEGQINATLLGRICDLKASQALIFCTSIYSKFIYSYFFENQNMFVLPIIALEQEEL